MTRDGPVARVTLNRPQLHNAFDEALIAGLAEAFQALCDDDAVRAVVLTGAGKSFSAGADLNWMQRAAGYDEERNRADARALELMLRTIDDCPKPVVAMVKVRPSAAGSASSPPATSPSPPRRRSSRPARCGWASCRR